MKTLKTIITENDKANISNSSVLNLTELTLPYDDVIPVEPDGSFDGTTQNTILKYFSGSITHVEHEAFKENNQDEETSIIVKIYDIILGNGLNNWVDNLDEKFIDEVTDLWLMRPREGFNYEVEFQKLIFMIYAKYETPKLRHIALDFHKNNAFAQSYVDYADKDDKLQQLFLINQKNNNNYTAAYNAKYGIKQL